METKIFNNALDLWSESLVKRINYYKEKGKYVYVIALSRKMPRFFEWLQKSLEDRTITSHNINALCELLNSDKVEVTTEYAIPLAFGNNPKHPKDKIAGIIADDVIIFGATLQSISRQWWAFSDEVPYAIALFRGINGVIASILESESTKAMDFLKEDDLEASLDMISNKINSKSLPIDIEYPLIYSDSPYEEVKKHIIENCPVEWIKYEVKSEYYSDSSESFSVILENGRNEGYTNDHAKIRLFKKPTGCCLEMIAPSYVNVLKLKDRNLFNVGNDTNSGLYSKVWQIVFDALIDDKEEGNKIFTTIQEDQKNQAILSSLIIWTEYLYCLSAFVGNSFYFFPENSNFNIRKEDLAMILGKDMADVVFPEITTIISGHEIFKPMLHSVSLQTYVNPEELRDIYFRKLATVLKENVPVGDNLDALYGISHFSSGIYSSITQKYLIMSHHCIGESFESLEQRIRHKYPIDRNLKKEINKWVDVRIDECRLAPKYVIVMGSDNQRYYRRMFLCGSNKIQTKI